MKDQAPANPRKRKHRTSWPEFFRYHGLSEYIDTPEATLRKWVADGQGPPSFILNPKSKRKIRLFPKAEVDAWLDNLKNEYVKVKTG